MDNSGLLKAISDSAIDYAVITMDNAANITTWNAGAEVIMGFSKSEMLGKHASIIFTPEDCAQGIPQKEIDAALRDGRVADIRWHMRKDGTRFWADGVLTSICDDNGMPIGFLKILRDFTDKKRMDMEILRPAHIDVLTGLANRSAFDIKLAEMITATLRSNQLLVLQLVDLDYFKQVNDSLGHHAGDELLKQAAQRMRSVTRDTDFIARIGGDEFVVLEPNAHTPGAGASLADKLLNVLSQPFHIDHHEAHISASIGIALCPQDAKELDQLLKKADLALYRVKNHGRNGFSYFTEHLDAEVHQKARNVAELKRAAKEQSFRLEYQPKIACSTGQVIAIEALLRCDNPVLSSYPIEEVITLAKEIGLMTEIGLWVLAEACSQAKKWQDTGVPYAKICVNLCSRELMHPTILENVDEILNRTGLHPGNLIVEITERELFESTEHGIMVLNGLHSRGIWVALDDFGAGYSSLNYLLELPIDMLKLDQSFLKNIPKNKKNCVIAKAIIDLAHTLTIDVAAEGVESAAQAEFFQRQNCDALQGFFFTKPLPPKDMAIWLANAKQAGSTNASVC